MDAVMGALCAELLPTQRRAARATASVRSRARSFRFSSSKPFVLQRARCVGVDNARGFRICHSPACWHKWSAGLERLSQVRKNQVDFEDARSVPQGAEAQTHFQRLSGTTGSRALPKTWLAMEFSSAFH